MPASRIASLIARRRDVRAEIRKVACEALGASPSREHALNIEEAIRAGILDAAGAADSETRAAAEEALRGLEDALAEKGVG